MGVLLLIGFKNKQTNKQKTNKQTNKQTKNKQTKKPRTATQLCAKLGSKLMWNNYFNVYLYHTYKWQRILNHCDIDGISYCRILLLTNTRTRLPDMSWRHTCMCAASFQYYSKSGGELKQNITMKRHAYSYINTKFRTHLKRVHSGHYSSNLCQKLPGDEFPAEIWQITGTGFNWVRAHSQNFVLVLGMRISFKYSHKWDYLSSWESAVGKRKIWQGLSI